MSAVTEALGRKIGPLPAWAWGIGLGVGFNVYRAFRNRQTPAADTTADTDTISDPLTGSTSAAGYPTPGSYAAVDSYTTAPTVPTGASAPLDTNTAWRTLAYSRLVPPGDPVAVSEALSKYLAGAPITAFEEQIVSNALTAVGLPPEGAPQITRADTAIVKPPKPPPDEWTPTSSRVGTAGSPYTVPTANGGTVTVQQAAGGALIVPGTGQQYDASTGTVYTPEGP